MAPTQNRPSCFWGWIPSTLRLSHLSGYCRAQNGGSTSAVLPSRRAITAHHKFDQPPTRNSNAKASHYITAARRSKLSIGKAALLLPAICLGTAPSAQWLSWTFCTGHTLPAVDLTSFFAGQPTAESTRKPMVASLSYFQGSTRLRIPQNIEKPPSSRALTSTTFVNIKMLSKLSKPLVDSPHRSGKQAVETISLKPACLAQAQTSHAAVDISSCEKHQATTASGIPQGRGRCTAVAPPA